MSYTAIGLLLFIVILGTCSLTAKVRSKGYTS